MSFFEFLIVGGIEFMGFLTLVLLVIIGLTGKKIYDLFIKPVEDEKKLAWGINYLKSLGIFALVVGILGQVVGLISGFEAIEMIKEISPAMLAGGLKVSSYTTTYGMVIFLISYLFWFLLKFKLDRLVLI